MRSPGVASLIAYGAVGYLLVVPVFWDLLPLNSSVHVPSRAAHDGAVTIEVTVASWHPNYQFDHVRFVPDYHASEFRSDVDTPHPEAVERNERKRRWSRLTLNRFTFPRRNTYEYEVSLADFADKGRMAPGTLRGDVEIRLSHPGGTASPSQGMGVRGDHERYSEPFEISLY